MTATYNVISTQTVSGTPTAVVFNSIPATFTDLVIVGTARYQSTGDDGGLRFNGDSSVNYRWQQLTSAGSTPVANQDNPSYLRVINNMDTNYDTSFEINIFNYTSTLYMKPVISRWGSRQSGVMYWGSFGGGWFATSTINSITIMKPNGGNWASDSVFTLIGITKE